MKPIGRGAKFGRLVNLYLSFTIVSLSLPLFFKHENLEDDVPFHFGVMASVSMWIFGEPPPSPRHSLGEKGKLKTACAPSKTPPRAPHLSWICLVGDFLKGFYHGIHTHSTTIWEKILFVLVFFQASYANQGMTPIYNTNWPTFTKKECAFLLKVRKSPKSHWYHLHCGIGGAKELGMMVFP